MPVLIAMRFIHKWVDTQWLISHTADLAVSEIEFSFVTIKGQVFPAILIIKLIACLPYVVVCLVPIEFASHHKGECFPDQLASAISH